MIENINVNSFFEFDLFLEASAEILNKIVGSFEINWPLSEAITIGNEQYWHCKLELFYQNNV